MQALIVSLAENLHAIVAIVATIVGVWATVCLRRSRIAIRRDRWRLRRKQGGRSDCPGKVDVIVSLTLD